MNGRILKLLSVALCAALLILPIGVLARENGEVYTLTYELDGGSAKNPTSYTEQSNDIILKNPTKKGYTFTGWSGTGLDGENNMTVTVKKGSTGNRNYTAHWSRSSYTVKYVDGKNGTIFKEQSYIAYYGDSTPEFVGDLSNITSYKFNGWDKKVSAKVTQSVTYTAKIVNKTANTLKLNGNGGKKTDGTVTYTSYTNGVKINIPNNPFVRDGYVFKEWNTASDGTGKKYVAGGVTEFSAIHNGETVNLYAQWTDIEKPVITGVENGKTYCFAQTVTVKDNESIANVTVNGNPVTLDNENRFELPASGEQKIVATDTSGNKSEITVTVNNSHSGDNATCCDSAQCDICKTEYKNQNNHKNLKHFDKKSPTSENNGNTEYWYCDGCGKYFADKDGKHEVDAADTVIEKISVSEDRNTGDCGYSVLIAVILPCTVLAVCGKKYFIK